MLMVGVCCYVQMKSEIVELVDGQLLYESTTTHERNVYDSCQMKYTTCYLGKLSQESREVVVDVGADDRSTIIREHSSKANMSIGRQATE